MSRRGNMGGGWRCLGVLQFEEQCGSKAVGGGVGFVFEVRVLPFVADVFRV